LKLNLITQIQVNGIRSLIRRPIRHRADAVLRAARDYPIAVRHVDQYITLTVEEAHDLKRFEHEAAMLVEDALAVLDLADELDRSDLWRQAMLASLVSSATSMAPFTPPVWAREISFCPAKVQRIIPVFASERLGSALR
jgi:hypothetical protein